MAESPEEQRAREEALRERAQADPVTNPQPAQPGALQRLQDAGKDAASRLGIGAQQAAREAQEQAVALIRDPVAARMVALLDGINDKLNKIAEGGGERQEMPPPGVWHIWPNRYVSSIRIRATKVVIASLAVQTLRVKVGADSPMTVALGANSTTAIDLPIVLDRGVDISLEDTTTGVAPVAANVADAWVIGFPE